MGINDFEEKSIKKKKHVGRSLDVVIICLSIILIAVVVFSVFFDFVKVLQSSMSPTIESGSYVVVKKTTEINRGDVVIFKDADIDDKLLIKRVIAVGGDSIKIDENGVLTIKYTDENGEEKTIISSEDYIKNGENIFLEETYINYGYVYLLGDNRLVSYDSSEFGEVKKNKIVGKVVWILK